MMTYTADNLLVPAQLNQPNGILNQVLAAQAGWEHLNMQVRRMTRGERWSQNTKDHEFLLVILSGQCHVLTNQGMFRSVGERKNVFAGKAHAVYLSIHTVFELEVLSENLEVATCWVAAQASYPARHITPDQCAVELRGGGNASRQIVSILPPGSPCERIVAVEVYAPGGNWSSYPPHKHDAHRVDESGTLIEADLEETYFYRFDRPGGHAYQRVYTDNRSIDALLRAQENDIVLIPAGYHPVVTAHGFTSYYLNFLAGSAQSLANADDPEFEWIKGQWPSLDPRLPIVC